MPQAKPIEVHKRNGTYRADRHGDGMPLLIAGRPDLAEFERPPRELDREAAQHWRLLVPDLIRSGILDRTDLPALILLCETWSDIRKHRRVLRERGQYESGSMGQPVASPSVRMLRDAISQYNQLAAAFGLDPLARTRLAVEGLTGRVLATELAEVLGPADLRPVDDDVIDGDAFEE
jgi:P27 family predicted phage terminase small subunit